MPDEGEISFDGEALFKKAMEGAKEDAEKEKAEEAMREAVRLHAKFLYTHYHEYLKVGFDPHQALEIVKNVQRILNRARDDQSND